MVVTHKAVSALRGSPPALQTGNYAPLYADPDVYTFARTWRAAC
jgi:hypothetical protein